MNRTGRLAWAFLAIVAFACPTWAQQFGRLDVKPGEFRQISIGPAYRMIRVCNDFGSLGTVVAAIGDGWSRTLSPGDCLEDAGNEISLRNRSDSSATITFKSSGSSWMQREK
jgi:hypothetical protein